MTIDYYFRKHYAPQNKDLYKDADGMFFLNYLNGTMILADEIESSAEEVVKHKVLIEQKLQQHKNEPIIWNKYAWCANYHNFFCDQYSCFSKEHKISLEKHQMTISRIL
jgi:hypothetical protein